MTAAKIMDIISRLPGCDGQAADAVSAYTQVKMEDSPKFLKIPKSDCPDIWIRLPRQKWPKSWSRMEDPVVPLERNLYGHPLAGLLWERQFEKTLLENCWEKVSVARSVQIWAQYFNIGFVKTGRMISDRDQQIRMLFLTQQFRMLFLTQHVELTSHGCVRQEIAIVQQTSHCYQNARATRDHTC